MVKLSPAVLAYLYLSSTNLAEVQRTILGPPYQITPTTI